MDQYKKEVLYTTSIHLDARDISKTKNIDGLIKHKLKKYNEKSCNKYGYVIKDSIQIKGRSIGKIVNHNASMIEYNITLKVDVIYPCEKDIFNVTIDNITKMGIIGYLSDEDFTIESSPILFIIPIEYIEDIELVKKDMNIQVEVLQSRIKYKSKQIQVVGKLVK